MICDDGLGSVKSGIQELEKYGYVRREQVRSPNGRMGRMNYVVSELPMSKNALDSEFVPQVKKPPTVNPPTEKPLADNSIQSSTKELNTNKSITNQSFFSENPEPPNKGWNERIDKAEILLKEQIEYDVLLERFEAEQLQELFELILEVYLHDDEYLYIGKERKITALVKRRFAMLDFHSVESIIDGLHSNTTKILDMKAYLLACLYNAPTTKHNKVSSQVNHDLGKTESPSNASYNLEALERMITEGSVFD